MYFKSLLEGMITNEMQTQCGLRNTGKQSMRVSLLVWFGSLLFLIHGWLNLSIEGSGYRGPLVLCDIGDFTWDRQQ